MLINFFSKKFFCQIRVCFDREVYFTSSVFIILFLLIKSSVFIADFLTCVCTLENVDVNGSHWHWSLGLFTTFDIVRTVWNNVIKPKLQYQSSDFQSHQHFPEEEHKLKINNKNRRYIRRISLTSIYCLHHSS